MVKITGLDSYTSMGIIKTYEDIRNLEIRYAIKDEKMKVIIYYEKFGADYDLEGREKSALPDRWVEQYISFETTPTGEITKYQEMTGTKKIRMDQLKQKEQPEQKNKNNDKYTNKINSFNAMKNGAKVTKEELEAYKDIMKQLLKNNNYEISINGEIKPIINPKTYTHSYSIESTMELYTLLTRREKYKLLPKAEQQRIEKNESYINEKKVHLEYALEKTDEDKTLLHIFAKNGETREGLISDPYLRSYDQGEYHATVSHLFTLNERGDILEYKKCEEDIYPPIENLEEKKQEVEKFNKAKEALKAKKLNWTTNLGKKFKKTPIELKYIEILKAYKNPEISDRYNEIKKLEKDAKNYNIDYEEGHMHGYRSMEKKKDSSGYQDGYIAGKKAREQEWLQSQQEYKKSKQKHPQNQEKKRVKQIKKHEKKTQLTKETKQRK